MCVKKVFILIILLLYNCAHSRIADGENTLIGSDVKKRIIYYINRTESYSYAFVSRPDLVPVNNFINLYIQPALIQIDDFKVYDKDSVEDCINKLETIFAALLGGKRILVQCQIKDAGIIDMGGIKAGNRTAKKNALLLHLLANPTHSVGFF